MKRTILFLAVLTAGIVLALPQATLDKADRKAVKIAENNVEDQWVLYTKDGKEVVIDKKTYGLNGINADIEHAEAELLYWQNVDPNEEQTKWQTEITRLNAILDKFDGPIE